MPAGRHDSTLGCEQVLDNLDATVEELEDEVEELEDQNQELQVGPINVSDAAQQWNPTLCRCTLVQQSLVYRQKV